MLLRLEMSFDLFAYVNRLDDGINHVKDEHGGDPDSIGSNFEILKKCQNKLDCLIFEMLFIRKLKPKLNKQSDSIRAKLFT